MSNIYSLLPEEYQEAKQHLDNTEFIDDFLKEVMPSKDLGRLTIKKDCYMDLKKFNPKKLKSESTSRRKRIRKKRTMTRKERRKLGLLKCPKTGWDYAELSSLREMWQEYIQEYLGVTNVIDHSALVKADLHGCEMSVVRSKCPSLVGKIGTCVMDTKNTFIIISPESKCLTIPKKDSVFRITVGNKTELTIYGKYFLSRSSERSVKKIKCSMVPDL